jgi:hypothetical protein
MPGGRARRGAGGMEWAEGYGGSRGTRGVRGDKPLAGSGSFIPALRGDEGWPPSPPRGGERLEKRVWASFRAGWVARVCGAGSMGDSRGGGFGPLRGLCSLKQPKLIGRSRSPAWSAKSGPEGSPRCYRVACLCELMPPNATTRRPGSQTERLGHPVTGWSAGGHLSRAPGRSGLEAATVTGYRYAVGPKNAEDYSLKF